MACFASGHGLTRLSGSTEGCKKHRQDSRCSGTMGSWQLVEIIGIQGLPGGVHDSSIAPPFIYNSKPPKTMKCIEESIVINAPLRRVYNQWTQFEEFPKFMEDVMSVQQVDDRNVLWHVRILGRVIEWAAEIHEQIPDERIVWRSKGGRQQSGTVEFGEISACSTRVTVTLKYELQSTAERICDALGVIESRIVSDLQRFRKFIETRDSPTGGWRGEIIPAEAVEAIPDQWTRY